MKPSMVNQAAADNRASGSKKAADPPNQQKQTNAHMRTIEGQNKDHGGTTSAMSSGAASGKGAAGPTGSHTQGGGPPPHAPQTKMAPMAMTSPIKIASVHNRP